MHYARVVRHGDPSVRLYGQAPQVEALTAGVYRVDLAGRGWARFDATDLDLVSSRRWKLTPQGYAKSGTLYMHRAIARAPDGRQVDHINRDRLDNRRANLRLVSHQGNVDNTTRAAAWGVERHGAAWRVKVKRRGRVHRVNGLPSREAAIAARDDLLRSLGFPVP